MAQLCSLLSKLLQMARELFGLVVVEAAHVVQVRLKLRGIIQLARFVYVLAAPLHALAISWIIKWL